MHRIQPVNSKRGKNNDNSRSKANKILQKSRNINKIMSKILKKAEKAKVQYLETGLN